MRSGYDSSVAFDARTGAFQQAIDIHRTSSFNQVIDTFVPLHYGTFGGLPIKILWCSAGLTLGVFAISGFVVWRACRPRRRSAAGKLDTVRREPPLAIHST